MSKKIMFEHTLFSDPDSSQEVDRYIRDADGFIMEYSGKIIPDGWTVIKKPTRKQLLSQITCQGCEYCNRKEKKDD